MPQILYHNLSCEWIKNISILFWINFLIREFEIFKLEFLKFINEIFKMKFFWREIWSQDKPHVDENSKAWNGKEFDSEVEERSIRKLFRQMSAEKRFVTKFEIFWHEILCIYYSNSTIMLIL